MPTIAQYLTELDKQRDALAANLNAKGVTASNTEKLNTLVPKVLQISVGGSPTKTTVYNANIMDDIYLQYNNAVYSLADFAALYPDFRSSENEYALNYSNMFLGWDVSVYTCSVTPIRITPSAQITIRFLSGSTETGILRLVQSDTGAAEDILTKAQIEGDYIGLPLQWVYSGDYITTLTPCEDITAGDYYLVWVGRSNNSHPLIRSIEVIY